MFHASHVHCTVRFGWRARALFVGLLLAGLLTVVSAAASAATLSVTTTSDDPTPNDGTVSLREAITSINAGNTLGDPDILAEAPGVYGTNDTINFNIGSGRQVISVGTSVSASGLPLPTIIKPVTINGYTEPGATANTLANGDNAVLEVALNGSHLGGNANGLVFGIGTGNSAGSTVRGLDIFGFSGNQVELRSPNDLVAGNDVGFDTTGSAASSGRGVLIAFASNSTIGGTTQAARNVISGNVGSGVEISGINAAPATGNVVAGNFIGVGPNGTSTNGNGLPAPNTHVGAVLVDGGNSNTIGGTVAGARNVIGGNGSGVDIRNGGQNNVVQGNFIGVGSDGVTQVPNSDFGVHVGSDGNLSPPAGSGQANEPPASDNIIGANPATLALAGAGNLIEFNGGDAVVVDGATAQNNATQAQNSGNSVLANSIFSNGGLGIDLKGVAANAKPNNLMGAPTITAVTPGASSTVIQGTLSLPGSGGMTVRVEMFSSATCDAGGSGEGQTFLGSVNATTDGSGNASFSTTVPVSVPSTKSVTATATNISPDPSTPAGSANLYNTSGFSRCFPPLPRTLTVTTTGTGSGTVAGSGISCPGTCSQIVADGSSVTLTATPAAGSTFTGWSGACSGSATCNLTMNGDQSVTATFTKKSAPPPPPPPPAQPPKCKFVRKSATVLVAGTRKVKGKHKRVSGALSVTISCDQAAAVTLKGTLTELIGKKPRHGKQRTRTFKLGPVKRSVRAAAAITVKLALPGSALTDLLHKAHESVTLVLAATNSNGTSRTSSRITKLKGRPR